MNWPDEELTCWPYRNKCDRCGTLWTTIVEECPVCSGKIIWKIRWFLGYWLLKASLLVSPPTHFQIVDNPDFTGYGFIEKLQGE